GGSRLILLPGKAPMCPTYYLDADGGGVGSTTMGQFCQPTPPPGYSTTSTDCNDADPSISALGTFYPDLDGDTYTLSTTAQFCQTTPPSGYRAAMSFSLDCN